MGFLFAEAGRGGFTYVKRDLEMGWEGGYGQFRLLGQTNEN